jgi:uncharacterized protein YndB with AHSA1/START domain
LGRIQNAGFLLSSATKNHRVAEKIVFKKILLGILVVIVGILLYALTKPDSFRVERSTTINASPQRVFSLIDNFHEWTKWSPWEKMDPAMQRSYSGSESGVGAAYAWKGNDAVGQGSMTITQATVPTHLGVQLDFIAPMETTNRVEFTVTPRGETTQVLWAMHGENNYLSKLMQVFVSMDSMLGKDFEAGLADLKAAAEAPAAAPAAPMSSPPAA